MWRDAAIADARARFPRESCGLVVDGMEYIPAENLAPGLDRFSVDPNAWIDASARGRVTHLVHSHPGASGELSAFDKAQPSRRALPWVVVGLPGGIDGPVDLQVHQALPSSLYGRCYIYGVHDCLSFARDWFLLERGIDLGAPDRLGRWWERGEDRYPDYLQGLGFIQVAAPEPGDIILMRIRAKVPNHCAVYLGGGQMAHHAMGLLSARTGYAETYRKLTHSVWRLA